MENSKITLSLEKIIQCEKHILSNSSQYLTQFDLLGFQNDKAVITLYEENKGLPVVVLKDLKHLLPNYDQVVNKDKEVAVEREVNTDEREVNTDEDIKSKEKPDVEVIEEIIGVKTKLSKPKPLCNRADIKTNLQISKPAVITNRKSILQGKQVIIKTNSTSGEKSLVFKQKTGGNVEIPAKLSSFLKCAKSSECVANQNIPKPLASNTKILVPLRRTPAILKRHPPKLDCNLTTDPHISSKSEGNIKEPKRYILKKVIPVDHDYIVSSENKVIEIKDKVKDLKKPLISTMVTNSKGLFSVSENKVLQPAKTGNPNHSSIAVSSIAISYENKKVLKPVISSGARATLVPVSALPSGFITYANKNTRKQMNPSNAKTPNTQAIAPMVVSYQCTPVSKQTNTTSAETVNRNTLQSILTPSMVVSNENRLLKPVSSSSMQAIPSIVINSPNEHIVKSQTVPVQFPSLPPAAVNYQIVNANLLKRNNMSENKSSTILVMIANKDVASNPSESNLTTKKKHRNIKPKTESKTEPKPELKPDPKLESKADSKPESEIGLKFTNTDLKTDIQTIKEDKSSQTVITSTKDVETNTDDDLLEAIIEQRILERLKKNQVTIGTNTESIPQHDITALSLLGSDSELLQLLDASMHQPIIDDVDFGTGPVIEPINQSYVGKSTINGKSISHCTDYTSNCTDYTSISPTQGKTISNRALNSLPVNNVPSGRLDMEPWKIQLFLDLKHCDQFDCTGNMPLHNAVIDNNIKMVKRQLLALRSRQLDVNTLNHESYTALQLALLYNAEAIIVQLLLQYGADIAVVDSDGNNIFHLCVMNSNENVMQTLLSIVGTSTDINSTNFDGYTPLILCALSKKHFMADALLAARANPNIGDKKSGRTPLFHAVESNDVEMVTRLLNNNAQTKVRNFFGTSPHDAMFELDFVDPVVKRLILNKDEPNRFKQEENRARKKRKSVYNNSGNDKVPSPKKPRSKPST